MSCRALFLCIDLLWIEISHENWNNFNKAEYIMNRGRSPVHIHVFFPIILLLYEPKSVYNLYVAAAGGGDVCVCMHCFQAVITLLFISHYRR